MDKFRNLFLAVSKLTPYYDDNMPHLQCTRCRKEFYAKPSALKQGWGKYCSPTCQYEGRKKGVVIKCLICNKERYRSKGVLAKSKSGKYFCSRSCQTKWRNSIFIGKKHANWKNGEYAYRSILTRHRIPKMCKLCNSPDERILAVHHIDHNHKNNILQNLTWLCHNCHFLVHHYSEEKIKLMVSIA